MDSLKAANPSLPSSRLMADPAKARRTVRHGLFFAHETRPARVPSSLRFDVGVDLGRGRLRRRLFRTIDIRAGCKSGSVGGHSHFRTGWSASGGIAVRPMQVVARLALTTMAGHLDLFSDTRRCDTVLDHAQTGASR